MADDRCDRIALRRGALWGDTRSHQFFPSSDRPELLVDIKLPQNATIYASKETAAQFDALISNDADIDDWSTYVGRGAVRSYLPLNTQLPNDFFTQAVIVPKDLDARDRIMSRLNANLETAFAQAVTRVYPLEQGPPVGWPLQYRVSGPDIEIVRSIALRLSAVISEDHRIRQLNFDCMEPARTLRIAVDQDQARLLGISSESLARAINTVSGGTTITQVRDAISLVDVVTRAVDSQRSSLETMRMLQLPLPDGRSVPLSQVARFEYDQENPMVWRRNRTPTLTVQADVLQGVLPTSVISAIDPGIQQLIKSLPKGYAVAAGGTAEESGKSQGSVAAVMPLMLFLTLTILMVQLQSFQRLFLVPSVAPLGLIGMVAALLVADKPLGFVAILGILALVGMIARNSVNLIDQIETEIRHGHSAWDAVVEATLHRLRPILLTAAAILGMLPIAPPVFWGPMAFAIMGGLAAATALTLVFLPSLYVVWFKVREL